MANSTLYAPQKYRVTLAPLAAFLLWACASESKEESSQVEEVVTADGDLTSNQTAADEEQAKEEGTQEAGNQAADEETVAGEDKKPIKDDGYDDNWNDIGSQQQKVQNANNQAAKNKAQQATNQGLEEEPPIQQQAAEPNVQAVPQTVLEEPPPDLEPAPVAAEPEIPPPPPAPEAAPPVVSGAPLVKSDVEPTLAQLSWVGYDYHERDALVRIEMVTRGSPKFNFFQERNQADQPEFVVRFFNTALRPKLERDIDASQFRSPVAYVRMRPNVDEASVDVILTMRDVVEPRMYTKHGNVLLTFAVPDHYFGNALIGDGPIARAEAIPNGNLLPDLDSGSDLPEGTKVAQAFVNYPGQQTFKEAPVDGGTAVVPDAVPLEAAAPAEPLPDDFSQEQSALPAPVDEQALPDEESQQADDEFDDDLGGEEVNGGQYEEDETVNENAQSDAESEEEDEFGDDDENDNGGELEDFEDGKGGESSEDIDKFDVRLRYGVPAWVSRWGTSSFVALPSFLFASSLATKSFGVAAVGADDEFDNESGNLENQAASNDNFGGNNNGSGNGNAQGTNQTSNETTEEPAEADFPGADTPTEGGEDLLGEDPALAQPAVNPVATEPAPPINPAFGNAAVGADPAIGGNTEDAPAITPAAVDTGVAPGEPPLDGQPDLAGTEQDGSESAEGAAPSAGGRPVKLDFRGAPLSEVIRVLGEESGVNFIISPELGKRPVDINLSGVPFNDALKAILQANSLGMAEVGPNLVRIDTLAQLASDKEAEEKRKQAEVRLAPVRVLVHRLSFAKLDETSKLIDRMLQQNPAGGAPVQNVAITSDQRTNSLIVKGTAVQLAMTKALIERIDLETPQVELKTRLVEVLKSFSDYFGISWFPRLNFDQGRGLGFGNLVFPNSMVSRYAIDAGGTSPTTAGAADFTFGSINDSVSLDLALAMEESRGSSEVLQSSSVIVEDNQQARIDAGQEEVVLARVTGGRDLTAQYTFSLNIRPSVAADGSVHMDFNLVSRLPAKAVNPQAAASSTTRELHTQLLRRSGQTAVIGGIYLATRDKGGAGIPVLSSIPIIGALFRSSEFAERKRELMVMVTPTILTAAKASAGSEVATGDASAEATGGESFDTELTNFGGQEAANGQSQGNNFGDENGSNLTNNNFNNSGTTNNAANNANTNNAANNAQSENSEATNNVSNNTQQNAQANAEAENAEGENAFGDNEGTAEGDNEEATDE